MQLDIYRAVVEGGKGSVIQDSFYLFFCAGDRLDAMERLQELTKTLFGELATYYEVHNVDSRAELSKNALEPFAFQDAYLVENGCSCGSPNYIKDAIIFMVGYNRERVSAAFEQGKKLNHDKLQK
jgi:hypothetical protein